MPLETAEKKFLDTEKKAEDEKQAKEKAEAAKSSAATSSAAKPIVSPGDPKSSAAAAKNEEKKPDDKKAVDKKPPEKSEDKKPDDKKPDPKPLATFPEEAKLDKLKADLEGLKIQGPVRIDAYISPEVPESYLQAKMNLLNVLDEFKRLGKENGMIEVNVNEIDRFDKLAEVAKTRYGIVPHDVFETRNGAFHHEKIFLGVAFTSGLEKVVVPFIDHGLSPEWRTRPLTLHQHATREARKRSAVLETSATSTDGQFAARLSGPVARLAARPGAGESNANCVVQGQPRPS